MIRAWKKEGERMSEVLDRIREEQGAPPDFVCSFAGRLDPLAEGEVLILVGEKENRERERYLALPKTYHATLLFGVETDTYDLLGFVTSLSNEDVLYEQEKIQNELDTFRGENILSYPPYSSKTVRGIPLWKHAREGTLEEVRIPKRVMDIREIVCRSVEGVESAAVFSRLGHILSLLRGDFRQREIQKNWRKTLKDQKKTFQTCEIFLTCSSGTYVRSIAHELGRRLGTGAILYKLIREHVGDRGYKNLAGK